MIDLVRDKFEGNEQLLGRALGYVDGSFVRQMMREGLTARLITEKTVRKIELLYGLDSWFSPDKDRIFQKNSTRSTKKNVLEISSLVPFLLFDQMTLIEVLNTDARLFANPQVTAWKTAGMRTKVVGVIDDAMYPLIQRGCKVQLDPDISPVAGDKILVVDGTGNYHLREYKVRASETFEAAPCNPAYPTLDSKINNLRVIAVATHVTRSIYAGD